MRKLVDWGTSAIDLNGSGLREAEAREQKEYMREIQDGIEESKQGSRRTRGREECVTG